MQEQPRMEVRAQALSTAAVNNPAAVEAAVANAQRPFVIQEDAEQCEVSDMWPSDRDFAAEMAAFPDGPIFVRGNAAEGTSGTTDQYNLEMQQKMKSNICYMHDAGPNYSYIIPSIICGSCPQEQSDIDHLRDVVRPSSLCLATLRVPLCGCPQPQLPQLARGAGLARTRRERRQGHSPEPHSTSRDSLWSPPPPPPLPPRGH